MHEGMFTNAEKSMLTISMTMSAWGNFVHLEKNTSTSHWDIRTSTPGHTSRVQTISPPFSTSSGNHAQTCILPALQATNGMCPWLYSYSLSWVFVASVFKLMNKKHIFDCGRAVSPSESIPVCVLFVPFWSHTHITVYFLFLCFYPFIQHCRDSLWNAAGGCWWTREHEAKPQQSCFGAHMQPV